MLVSSWYSYAPLRIGANTRSYTGALASSRKVYPAPSRHITFNHLLSCVQAGDRNWRTANIRSGIHMERVSNLDALILSPRVPTHWMVWKKRWHSFWGGCGGGGGTCFEFRRNHQISYLMFFVTVLSSPSTCPSLGLLLFPLNNTHFDANQ